MPIPFILAGIAIAAGVGAGCVAASDFDDAKSVAESARSKYQQKKREFDKAEQETKARIEDYGKLKVYVYQSIMKNSFLPAYRRFEKLAGISDLREDSAFTAKEIKRIENNIGIAGGALSAGGLGMAGGAALLGGIVAAPFIAITGFAMASKADKALTDACQYSGDVDKACAEMERYITHSKALQARCDEITGQVKRLSERLQKKVSQLNSIPQGVKELSEKELHHVDAILEYAKTLKGFLDIPVVDEAGKINPSMVKMIEQAKNIT